MKIYIETYGCTANKSDENIIKGVLIDQKHEIVSQIATADILLILTCTVIGTTEQRMLSRLRLFKKTCKPVIVAGCMPAVQPELITNIIPTAQMLRPEEISGVTELLEGKKIIHYEKNKTRLPAAFNDITAPIAIAEGCMFSCSYCITHFARGMLHSYPCDEIAGQVNHALAQGCKEIQLTAQDTASYGYDTGAYLDSLLSKICLLPHDFRIRIGMMNPYTAKQRLTNILPVFNYPQVYKFIHLPVQSGDDTILQKMNRQYTVTEFYELLKKIRKQYPDISLSTDVIIGFPTETDEQFHQTCMLLKEIQPDIVNITRYSARPHTNAKKMIGRIPTKIAKERSIHISDLCIKLLTEKNKKHHGKKYTALITEHGKNNTFLGRTETYKPVVLTEPVQIGSIIPVHIIDSSHINLYGKLI